MRVPQHANEIRVLHMSQHVARVVDIHNFFRVSEHVPSVIGQNGNGVLHMDANVPNVVDTYLYDLLDI